MNPHLLAEISDSHDRSIGQTLESPPAKPGDYLSDLFDDLVADPVGLCQKIQQFLAIDTSFRPDISRADVISRNESGIPMHGAVAWLRNMLLAGGPSWVSAMLKPMISREARQRIYTRVKQLLGAHGIRKPHRLPADCRNELKGIYREEK